MLRVRIAPVILSATLTLSSATLAAPVDLLKAFDDAAHHDPTYQSQQAQYQATRMQLPETYSALLPQLDITAAIDREWDHVKGTGSGTYTTHNYGLSATQSIFDWNLIRRISREAFTVRSAATELAYNQQQLIIRTAAAYYRVLEQQDILRYTQQQVGILKRQLDQTEELFNHKEATITAVDQVKGAYFDRLNDLVEAKLDLYVSKQELSTITSVQYTSFSKLRSYFPLITPKPKALSTWEQNSTQHNLNINAARFTVEAAKRNISAQRGGYLPVINAQGGYTRTKEPTTDTSGLTTQNTRDANIGLGLTWRVFQGGLTIAQVKQAEANYQQSIADMQGDYLNTLSQARSAYEGIIRGREGILHARAAINWNTKALMHGQEAFKSGETTVTDLLEIQDRLFDSENKYARDTYRYLNDILLLKQAAGSLNVHDLAIQNQWLRQ
jgi:outer membrane protein